MQVKLSLDTVNFLKVSISKILYDVAQGRPSGNFPGADAVAAQAALHSICGNATALKAFIDSVKPIDQCPPPAPQSTTRDIRIQLRDSIVEQYPYLDSRQLLRVITNVMPKE